MNKTPAKTYTFSQKWGDDPFTEMGHAQVPTALLEYSARLTIEPEEGYLICCILHFKRTPSDKGPSQEKLAEMFGKSSETVRRLLRRLEKRGLLRVMRERDKMGYYSHTTYDWTLLRACLNECYYQDFPAARPKGWKSPKMPADTLPTTQYRGVVRSQFEKTKETQMRGSDPTKLCFDVHESVETTPPLRVDSVRVFRVIEDSEDKEEPEFSASLFSEQIQTDPAPDLVRVPSPAALSQARKELAKPWFLAQHGRYSDRADWTQRAWEIDQENSGLEKQA